MTPAAKDTGIYLKLVLGALFWGASYVAARLATGEMPAISAALWRYVVATIALLAIALALEGGLPRLDARQWVSVLLLGATGVALFNLCFMFGLARVTAARASLIMALNPALTLAGAARFLHEPLTRRNTFGIALALFGVTLILSHGELATLHDGSVGIGDLVLLGCPLSWAAYALLGKRMLQGLSPIAATAYAALTGTAVLAIVAAFTGHLGVPHASSRAWGAIGFIGLFSTAIAFVWFYEGVQRIGAARTAVFVNVVPIAAILLGFLILGERLDASMLVGGTLVLLGVWLLNRARAPETALAPIGRGA